MISESHNRPDRRSLAGLVCWAVRLILLGRVKIWQRWHGKWANCRNSQIEVNKIYCQTMMDTQCMRTYMYMYILRPHSSWKKRTIVGNDINETDALHSLGLNILLLLGLPLDLVGLHLVRLQGRIPHLDLGVQTRRRRGLVGLLALIFAHVFLLLLLLL